MTLGDVVSAALPNFRAEAESMMLDACLIGRVGELAEDPETGQVVPAHTTIYEGKCKVQQTVAQSTNPDAGGHQFTVLDFAIHLPVGAGIIAIDDTVTIERAAFDPRLVGRVFRVVELFHKTLATAQRIRVKEVVA